MRALVRDVPKARTLLENMPGAEGATLEVVAADLSQPATVREELFEGVRAVVSCASVIVQLKEGDEDRSKCAPRHPFSNRTCHDVHSLRCTIIPIEVMHCAKGLSCTVPPLPAAAPA